jgi:hypothetical protein
MTASSSSTPPPPQEQRPTIVVLGLGLVKNMHRREDHYILLNILGRHSRYIQAMDLLTGKRWEHRNTDVANMDPAGMPLNDLNHIQTVLVDSVVPSTNTSTTTSTNTKKEIWLPCGFQGDKVDFETFIHYARIVDLETFQIRTGPKLPYPGGACVALPMTILPNEPPMICSFAGTDDSGKFLATTTCYDRLRKKFFFPFGRLPFGLDHGSISCIPKGTCHESDPAKLIILNYRTHAYGLQRTEMLGFDVPENGWTLEELQSDRYRMQETGNWYIFANISYAYHNDDPQDFRLNAPLGMPAELLRPTRAEIFSTLEGCITMMTKPKNGSSLSFPSFVRLMFVLLTNAGALWGI